MDNSEDQFVQDVMMLAATITKPEAVNMLAEACEKYKADPCEETFSWVERYAYLIGCVGVAHMMGPEEAAKELMIIEKGAKFFDTSKQ